MSDKIVMVKWVDSLRNSAWDDRASHERLNASECISIGFLLVENDEKITIYQSDDRANHSVGCSLTIPKVAVISVVELRRK